MNGPSCPPKKDGGKTMKEIFSRSPPKAANLAKKLGTPPPSSKGKK